MSFIHNSTFGQTVPTTAPTPAQLANNPHSQASLSVAQMSQHAQQQFNAAYSQHAQQGVNQTLGGIQQQAAQMAAWGAQQVAARKHMWMWNGVPMDVVDFAKHAYGDTPEATHFILKYKEIA